MDLPTTRHSASTGGGQQASAPGGVRLASATSEVGDRGGSRPVALLSSRDRYSYDPQYRWLKGKLEYSQIDRRWKLRYIPIDGATDDFGGSVILSDESLLSGCERGDFVEVHGRLGQRSKDEHDYSPVYEVAEIKHLAG